MVNPKLCITSSTNGVLLFVKSVFPSLFPFLVFSNIIIAYDGVVFYSKLLGKFLCKPLKLPKECSIVLIVSALCGYPLGAKYTCDLYSERILDFETSQRLINIASNASPLFIIGVVGTSFLNSVYLGYLLLISCYLSCFIMGRLLPKVNYNKNIPTVPQTQISTNNLGNVLKNSIANAMSTSLTIGGFIIIFSVIIDIIKNNAIFSIVLNLIYKSFNIPTNLSLSLSLGIIELTNGCSLMSSININIFYKIIIISFLLSFSSFSIILQVLSFTAKHNFSSKKYIFYKFIQGIITSIISSVLYILFHFLQIPITTFSSIKIIERSNYFSISVIALLALISVASYYIKKLFHAS